MKKSIMVSDTEHCIYCFNNCVEEHHIFFGTANRTKADKYRLTVPLCNKHHTGSDNCPHRNRIIDLSLKMWGQTVYEREIGTRQEFIKDFGKSYL